MDIHFIIQIWQEEKTFVSYSPQLDIASCGNSIEEAKNLGTLEEILNECGFHQSGKKWESPDLISFEKTSMKI